MSNSDPTPARAASSKPVATTTKPLALPAPSLWPYVTAFPQGSLPAVATPLAELPEDWSLQSPARAAAVCMLFLPPVEPGTPATVVFTRRTTTVRSHKGQIGFPGGRVDPEDQSPLVTALREAHEELGIAPERIHPLGALPFVRALDGGLVVPVLGLAAARLDELVPSPSEVDLIFLAPWTRLTRAAGQDFSFNIFGHWRNSCLYTAEDRDGGLLRIWGLTAKIIHSANLA